MEAAAQQSGGIGAWLVSRPLIAFTILLAGGIVLRDWAALEPQNYLIATAGFCIAAIAFRRRGFVATIALAAATVFLGISISQIDRYQFRDNDIANFSNFDEQLTQVELYLDQAPRIIQPSPLEQRKLAPHQEAVASVRRILTKSGWTTASGKTLVFLEEPNSQLQAGQLIRVTGTLERPNPPMNPGEFDYQAWCRDQRILATVRVRHAGSVQIESTGGPTALQWLQSKTRSLLANGFSATDDQKRAELEAIVLGDPDPKMEVFREQFVQSGLAYQFSVSGLHVGAIGAAVLLVCRLLRHSPRFAVFAAMSAVILYALVALPTWSGWRAVIMCGAAAIGLLNRRNTDSLQLFFVAIAIILLIHPSDLENGGFQISFVTVLGLLLFVRRMNSRVSAWWRGPDPKPVAFPQNVPAILWRRSYLKVLGMFAASAVAWLMSAPLVAYHFGYLYSYSVPAGILLLPLTIISLLGGVLKILLTLILPWMAVFWANACAIPLSMLGHCVASVAKIPGASATVSQPTIGFLLIYYGLISLAFLVGIQSWKRWVSRLSPALACAVLAWWSLGGQMPSQSRAGELRITLLSIGAGQCAVVELPSGHTIMVDAGSSTISDVAHRTVEPYFHVEHFGLNQIFLSHGDFDHISAAAELFADYSHPQIFTSPQFAKHALVSTTAEALLHTLQAANDPPSIIHRGQHFQLDASTAMDVLWPPADCDMNSNNCGLVLKMSFAGRSVIFPADIQEPPETALLADPAQLRADVLVAPHHGSAELTTAAFIHAVHPSIILASNADKLSHKQKTFDELATGYPLYRTSRDGAITLTIEPTGKMDVETFLGVGPAMHP